MKILPLLLLSASALFTASAHAAEYWVGAGSSCDFATIEQAIAAARITPEADTIRIVRNGTYPARALLLDTPVSLIGGHRACGDMQREGYTSLTGNGQQAVLVAASDAAEGVEIHLDRLEIHGGGGTETTTHWGGLSIAGNARVHLYDSVVRNNRVLGPLGHPIRFGGGVTVRGNRASLTIERWVDIRENSGDDGGGILVDGGVLNIRPHGVTIKQNQVYGNGKGGGIAIVNSGLMSVQTDPKGLTLPVDGALVGYNLANASCGGGIYVDGANSTLLASNLIVENNESRLDSGGGLCVTGGGYAQLAPSSDGPFRNCPPEQDCLRISDNIAKDAGAAVSLRSGGTARLDGVVVRGNVVTLRSTGSAPGGNAFHLFGNASRLNLLGSLVTDNACSADEPECPVISMFGGNLRFEHVTFARNGNEGGALVTGRRINASEETGIAGIRGYSSVLADKHQLYTPVIDPLTPEATISVDCMLKNRGRAEGARGDVRPIAFHDADAGNYRLVAGSAAIDYCDGVAPSSQDPDLNRQPRGIDDPNHADRYGAYDLGAYEFGNVPDRLFANGFDTAS